MPNSTHTACTPWGHAVLIGVVIPQKTNSVESVPVACSWLPRCLAVGRVPGSELKVRQKGETLTPTHPPLSV